MTDKDFKYKFDHLVNLSILINKYTSQPVTSFQSGQNYSQSITGLIYPTPTTKISGMVHIRLC